MNTGGIGAAVANQLTHPFTAQVAPPGAAIVEDQPGAVCGQEMGPGGYVDVFYTVNMGMSTELSRETLSESSVPDMPVDSSMVTPDTLMNRGRDRELASFFPFPRLLS